jgi:P27 family predicted phage terminase small subunit
MAGRRPKPTALKELQGNPGKRALNKHEPKPGGIPKCPVHLDKDAKREWKRISVELIALGLLTSVDMAALAAYCSAYSRWAAAEKNIQKFGMVIRSKKSGEPVKNPYVLIADAALDHLRKFGTEFGLTPASRSRLQVEPPTVEKDAFTAFMEELGAGDLETNESDPEHSETGTVHPGSSDRETGSQ